MLGIWGNKKRTRSFGESPKWARKQASYPSLLDLNTCGLTLHSPPNMTLLLLTLSAWFVDRVYVVFVNCYCLWNPTPDPKLQPFISASEIIISAPQLNSILSIIHLALFWHHEHMSYHEHASWWCSYSDKTRGRLHHVMQWHNLDFTATKTGAKQLLSDQNNSQHSSYDTAKELYSDGGHNQREHASSDSSHAAKQL